MKILVHRFHLVTIIKDGTIERRSASGWSHNPPVPLLPEQEKQIDLLVQCGHYLSLTPEMAKRLGIKID